METGRARAGDHAPARPCRQTGVDGAQRPMPAEPVPGGIRNCFFLLFIIEFSYSGIAPQILIMNI
ncbi:hypothetical protein L533_0491 [Bordetella bronchiseptica OSU553]|nr:hypothetical protein L533_0491 [Bordetella bronchiseptica OSU553]